MIQHILLWQFTEQAKKEGAAEKLAYLQRAHGRAERAAAAAEHQRWAV